MPFRTGKSARSKPRKDRNDNESRAIHTASPSRELSSRSSRRNLNSLTRYTAPAPPKLVHPLNNTPDTLPIHQPANCSGTSSVSYAPGRKGSNIVENSLPLFLILPITDKAFPLQSIQSCEAVLGRL